MTKELNFVAPYEIGSSFGENFPGATSRWLFLSSSIIVDFRKHLARHRFFLAGFLFLATFSRLHLAADLLCRFRSRFVVITFLASSFAASRTRIITYLPSTETLDGFTLSVPLEVASRNFFSTSSRFRSRFVVLFLRSRNFDYDSRTNSSFL